MKKPKKSPTVSLRDKQTSVAYSNKIKDLINDTLPKNILGMLASANERENSLIFSNRWQLIPHGKNDYAIFDLYTGETAYEHIALFSSAVKILWFIDQPLGKAVNTDRVIYSLDQEYYRCLKDIKFFKSKLASKTEKYELYEDRLSQFRYRLEDIKTEISKIY